MRHLRPQLFAIDCRQMPNIHAYFEQYMLRQVLFGVKRRSFLSHMTGDSLREKALGDRRQWRNVLSHLTAREVT